MVRVEFRLVNYRAPVWFVILIKLWREEVTETSHIFLQALPPITFL